MSRLLIGYSTVLSVVAVLADTGVLNPLLEELATYPLGDKIVHFLLVGTFALLLNMAVGMKLKTGILGKVLPGTLLALAIATGEECSNLLVVSRTYCLSDLVANYLGILCLGVIPAVWMLTRPGTSRTATG